MITRRCSGPLTVALLLCGCGGGSGGGVTSALIETLPVGDDLKVAIQQVVDDDADEVDVAGLIDERTSYRDGLSRVDDAIDSFTDGAKDTVDFGDAFSLALSSETVAASSRGAAGAGALLGRAMGGGAAFARNAHFEGGFMALAPGASSGVARYDLSSRSAMSVTLGAANGGEELAVLDYAGSAGDALALGMRAGMVRERGGLTGFVEGRFARRMGPTTAVVGEIGIGHTAFDGGAPGGATLEGTLISVETRLGVAMSDVGRAGDRLTVSAGVPMHGAGGDTRLRRATGRDADGGLTHTVADATLGSDIPVEMRLDYVLPLGAGITAGIDGAMRRDTGGRVGGDLALGLRMAF